MSSQLRCALFGILAAFLVLPALPLAEGLEDVEIAEQTKSAATERAEADRAAAGTAETPSPEATSPESGATTERADGPPQPPAKSAAETPTADLFRQIVKQLDDADPARRDAAERQLIDWIPVGGGAASDVYLALFPPETSQMPAETRLRLGRVRRSMQAAVAAQAAAPARLTLELQDVPLREALAEIERQTGNRLLDFREQFGQPAGENRVTLQLTDAPFWNVVDQLMDELEMAPYFSSGEEGLGLIARDPKSVRRSDKGVYAGPFRIECAALSSRRDFRQPDESELRVELELSWEPRLRPLALSIAASSLHVEVGEGLELPLASDQSRFEVEVQSGSHAGEVVFPVRLPARRDVAVESLRGALEGIVPGEMVEFTFENLAADKRSEKTQGGVKVVLERVRQNEALWEVYMRLSLEKGGEDFERYRNWALNNRSILRNAAGRVVDNAGFETTVQTSHEMGCAYFFELPEGESIDEYTWAYRAPASLVRTTIEFDLQRLLLP